MRIHPNWFVVGSVVVLLLLPLSRQSVAEDGQVAIGQLRPKGATAEQEIRAALERQVQLSFEESSLQTVTDQIEKVYKINIELDVRALNSVGIEPDVPVTRHLHDVSLRSALRLILRELELTYMIQDEVLMITTPEEAEATLKHKFIDVSDLVFRKHMRRPLLYTPDDAQPDFNTLIGIITTTVAPESWSEVGGPGFIIGVHVTDRYVLLVSHTEDMLELVEERLEEVRNIKPVAGPKRQADKSDDDIQEVFVQVYPLRSARGDVADEVAGLVRDGVGKDSWSEEQGDVRERQCEGNCGSKYRQCSRSRL